MSDIGGARRQSLHRLTHKIGEGVNGFAVLLLDLYRFALVRRTFYRVKPADKIGRDIVEHTFCRGITAMDEIGRGTLIKVTPDIKKCAASDLIHGGDASAKGVLYDVAAWMR